MASPFCSRISRNSGNAAVINFPNLIDTSFINIGEETSKGVDVNTRFVTNFGQVRMTWDNQYTLQTEREVTIFKGESSEDLLEDFVKIAKLPLSRHLQFKKSFNLIKKIIFIKLLDVQTAIKQALKGGLLLPNALISLMN